MTKDAAHTSAALNQPDNGNVPDLETQKRHPAGGSSPSEAIAPISNPAQSQDDGGSDPKQPDAGTFVYIMKPLMNAEEPREVQCLKKYRYAVQEFEDHYNTFAQANSRYIRVEDRDVESALLAAESARDVQTSADLFGNKIIVALKARAKKEEADNAKWSGRLCIFLKKLYPVANVSLQLTGSAAQVTLPPTVLISRLRILFQ